MRILAALLLLCSLTVAAQEPTITLNGTAYTMTAHPRVFFNPALDARIKYNAGPAPKAVNTNVAWNAMTSHAASFLSAFPYNNLDNSHAYQDGSAAFLYAQIWYADNSQTSYLTAAVYLLNNVEKYVPFLCIETTKDCVNGGDGFYAGSYGPAYWEPNWTAAYELMRGQMTTLQQQTFANKFLNDLNTVLGGGIGGSPSTSCTNRSSITTATVTFSSGNITASAPLFGSGQSIQVGDWIYANNTDTGGVIAAVTDSTHARIESDLASSFGSYSGTIFYLNSSFTAGDCGWHWVIKHDWYTTYSVIGSTTAYPSAGLYGGGNGTGSFNLTLSSIWGMQNALLSLADDDVNFSTRTSPQITAIYNNWYTGTFLGLNEKNYTGFTPTGSVYGIFRANTFYPLTAYGVVNSVVSPPPLMSGVWAKNFTHHFYLNTFPSCPAQEPEYGQSFGPDSSFNSFMPYVPGLPALITIYKNDPEGQYLNYWMQNIWSTCADPTGTIPGTSLKWSTPGLQQNGNSNQVQAWWFLYTDPVYTLNSALPTGSIDNVIDDPTGQAMAGAMSRTGYTSITDTLTEIFALAAPFQDHNLPQGGNNPGAYRIHKGSFMLADDSGAGNYGSGGPQSMSMEVGGDTNISSSYPFIAKMPLGHSDANYAYAETDSTQSYLAGANATAVLRHWLHFKETGKQDFIVIYDYVTSSSGNTKQTYLHYPQGAVSHPSTPTGSTTFTSPNVTSTFNGNSFISNVDAAQLLTTILSPAGTNSVYAYTQNSNGSYTGGSGYTFRVSVCASTTGSSCDTGNTTAEFTVVHEPVAGTGNTMPTTAMLATVDGSHRGIQVSGTAPKVAIVPIGTGLLTSASWTSTHTGSGQYVIAGMSAGTYTVKLAGATILTPTVAAGDSTISFDSTAGAFIVASTTVGINSSVSGTVAVSGSIQ